MVEAEIVGVGDLGGRCVAEQRLSSDSGEEGWGCCAALGGVIEQRRRQRSIIRYAAKVVTVEGAD